MQQVSDFKDFFERDLKIKDFSIDGKCSNCGGCCNDIIPYSEYLNHIKECKYNNIKYECQIKKYSFKKPILRKK